jgi:ubiquinone biosynthesis protein UbiJ
MDAVAQAIAHPASSPLPTALKRAIAQFPDRVQTAIDYLSHQQQKRQIKNPVGYLYEAIVEGWNLVVPQATLASSAKQHVPDDFSEWFDQMKAQGLVVAATTIEGVHHTLHMQQGWVPTQQLMSEAQECELNR